MPKKIQPSDDPGERKRNLVVTNEANETAKDQNAADRHAGRTPTYGAGTMGVLGKRMRAARQAVDDMPTSEA